MALDLLLWMTFLYKLLRGSKPEGSPKKFTSGSLGIRLGGAGCSFYKTTEGLANCHSSVYICCQ